MKEYQVKKHQLFISWLQRCAEDQIQLFSAGAGMEEWTFSDQLADFLSNRSSEECIYIMTALIPELDTVPLYIGKSTHVFKRWKAHLESFEKGQKSYAAWQESLLDESKFRYDVHLVVVPQSNIVTPPIPEFPTTVGSVEYQLIGLASDVYAEYLLNKEGNRR